MDLKKVLIYFFFRIFIYFYQFNYTYAVYSFSCTIVRQPNKQIFLPDEKFHKSKEKQIKKNIFLSSSFFVAWEFFCSLLYLYIYRTSLFLNINFFFRWFFFVIVFVQPKINVAENLFRCKLSESPDKSSFSLVSNRPPYSSYGPIERQTFFPCKFCSFKPVFNWKFNECSFKNFS